jgi:hypothetical protein
MAEVPAWAAQSLRFFGQQEAAAARRVVGNRAFAGRSSCCVQASDLKRRPPSRPCIRHLHGLVKSYPTSSSPVFCRSPTRRRRGAFSG